MQTASPSEWGGRDGEPMLLVQRREDRIRRAPIVNAIVHRLLRVIARGESGCGSCRSKTSV
jgi:hypothetical protein